MNLGKMIFNNFWAKVIALILAVATWFYVFDLVNTDSFIQKKERVEDIFSRYKFIVKEVPIEPVFSGKAPSGYTNNFEKVIITPSKISIFGPEDILEDVTELRTDKIDLSEYTKDVNLKVGFNSDIKDLGIEGKVVDVFLPVEPLQIKEAGKKQQNKDINQTI